MSIQEYKTDQFWDDRYRTGGTSGIGSYGRLGDYKARIINQFVEEHCIKSIIDFGCGDGEQISKLKIDNIRYLGIDVSEKAIELCKKRFAGDKNKRFELYKRAGNYTYYDYELVLSLDVIYHLIEDRNFEKYMYDVFGVRNSKYVMIYSINTEKSIITASHIKCREFTRWVVYNIKDWKLIKMIDNPFYGDGTFSRFYIYERRNIKN